jgi:hypothetical protein
MFKSANSPWIANPKFDVLWFIFPQLIPAIIIFLLPSNFLESQKTEIFPFSWLFIVLAIDVAHVYSTVYKTYFKKSARIKFSFLLKFLPFFVWMGGILIYSISSYLFWSCLAYFAVFHFIRQQYGFFRLYSKEKINSQFRKIYLNLTIYATTVIPVLIWHFQGQQNFNWMLKGDFKYINLPQFVPFLKILFVLILLIYLFFEFLEKKEKSYWNLGRIMLTLSTAFAWYACIVMINNDFTFSLVNVIGHGIPYLALVWFSEKKSVTQKSESFRQYIFSKWGLLLFYAIVFIFAYAEEGIWDTLVWREHSELFSWMYIFPTIDSHKILAFVIPLLIMPQVVHYILDAYIWKKKSRNV